MRPNLHTPLQLLGIMFIGMGPKDMSLVELQLMRLFIGLLLNIALMLVVPVVIGDGRAVLGLAVVVLEDLGVESLVLVDGLASDDGPLVEVGVVFGLI